MTTDNRLDYIIGRVDDACDRLARLEQLMADHISHSAEKSGFWRWALPTALSIGSLLVSVGILLHK